MRPLHVLGIVVFLAPALAFAQSSPSQPPAPGSPGGVLARVGEVDFGVRLGSTTGEVARNQRFRDLRDGPTLDRFRYERPEPGWTFKAAMDHVGYRDQRYTASVERYGRLKASFDWNQVPLFYSADTRTPFRQSSPNTFRLDNALRGAIQNGNATTAVFIPESTLFELRSLREIADARFSYRVTPPLDLRVSFTSTGRTGSQPWGASLGQANAVELPVALDHRTNDLNATAEWTNERAMARLAYDGSWFRNDVETLVWDNPLRLTDLAATPAQGRMALWPDSTAHTVSATGSMALPARSRAFASVSVGSWLQDQALLPFTINTAIPAIALSRPSAEAEARIVSMQYRLTSRPTSLLWLNGQFRLYDYDNRTPPFPVSDYVRVDSGAAASLTGGSEPFGYTRQFADLDASLTPTRFVAFRVGYGREEDDRTFRFLDETTEQVFRASVDSTGLAWGSVRLQYDRSVRTGRGLDEQVLSDIGEQVSLRQFDISDRTRDRVTTIVQWSPADSVGLNASAALGEEKRPGVAFGLQDNDLKTFTVGVDLSPVDTVMLGTTYGFEQYTTLQRSRQANPGVQFDDPTRDWSTDLDERVHTATAYLDLAELTPRDSAKVTYEFVRSNGLYRYLLPADTTLVAPVQLPAVRNEIQRASIDIRHIVTRSVTLGAMYAYDKYDVDDFATSPTTLNSPVFPAQVSLMYQWRPYAVHTGSVRLMYRW
ncbi:MAG: MtrB/PioB family outer membrane beta-barrel protein [Acidobacteria bacterium]|nr:MtrB/PioB family outer membrane beta-barrel protein [Acidobacteriota bacterium]